jgi:hypothetical protein
MPKSALRSSSMPQIYTQNTYFIYESLTALWGFLCSFQDSGNDIILVMNTLFFPSDDLSYLINQR